MTDATMEEADKTIVGMSAQEVESKLGYIPWEGEIDAGPDGLLDHSTYKYVAFPHEPSATREDISKSPVFKAFMKYAEDNPALTAQRFQRIICGPEPEVNLKAFAFMSTATKDWRDRYLQLMVDEGEMEVGWQFCKDRNWQGYLRTDLRLGNIYEDPRATRAAKRKEREDSMGGESEESVSNGKSKGKKGKGTATGGGRGLRKRKATK